MDFGKLHENSVTEMTEKLRMPSGKHRMPFDIGCHYDDRKRNASGVFRKESEVFFLVPIFTE